MRTRPTRPREQKRCTRRTTSRHDKGMRTLATQLLRATSRTDRPTHGRRPARRVPLASGPRTTSPNSSAGTARSCGASVAACCPTRADAEDAFQATFLVLVAAGESSPLIRPSARGCTASRSGRPGTSAAAMRAGSRSNRRSPSRFTLHTATRTCRSTSTRPCFRCPRSSARRSCCATCSASRGPMRPAARLPGRHAFGVAFAWAGEVAAKLNVLDPAKPLGLVVVAVPTGLASSAVRRRDCLAIGRRDNRGRDFDRIPTR